MEKSDNKINNCFIITPIGDNNSVTRRAAEGAIDAAIIPALIEIGIKSDDIHIAHRISELGSINNQIIEKIVESDIVIANLTGLNPNVMYELGIRHSAMKPVITICENNQKLPFDVTEERTIFYDNDMSGVIELKARLINLLEKQDLKIDNPVTRGIRASKLLDTTKVEGTDKLDYIVEKMLILEEKISNIYYSEGENRVSLKYNNNSKRNSFNNSPINNKIWILKFGSINKNEIDDKTSKLIINLVMNTFQLFFIEVNIINFDKNKEFLNVYVEYSMIKTNHYFTETDIKQEIANRLPKNIELLSL